MIYTTTRIVCNECSTEEPDGHYCGVRTWVFAKIKDNELKEIEEKHFCSKECFDNYLQDQNYELLEYYTLKSNDEKFREILNKDLKLWIEQ